MRGKILCAHGSERFMDKYSTQQCIQVAKFFYQNRGSIIQTQEHTVDTCRFKRHSGFSVEKLLECSG
ncbi:Hypothetical predicted protein [Octopus vulgaris]|uniref:Uncharacterized protein n=1 Tax=Octopus vulgaris TaxID=6645 RepID=A0AA36B0H7_OCTVU|nr:Hypothetical predicted protein [Octopus vulgaris]